MMTYRYDGISLPTFAFLHYNIARKIYNELQEKCGFTKFGGGRWPTAAEKGRFGQYLVAVSTRCW